MSDIPKEASSNLIQRTALDSFGQIGFFYDGHRDQVLKALTGTLPSKSYPINELSRCEILPRNKSDGLNFIQLSGIDDDSRLSVLLNLRAQSGIAEIYKHSNPIHEYTRVFRYTYVEREEKHSKTETKDPQKILTQLQSNTLGTHIITEIKWGIDVMVVLELLTSLGVVEEVDRMLNRICDYLKNDNDISSLGVGERNSLDKIIHTKIYSNTNEINPLLTLNQVCLSIQQLRRTNAKYPISYGVQPISYLFPQHTNFAPKFVALSGEVNQRIQPYLLSITSDVKRSNLFLEDVASTLVSKSLSRELHEMEKQCLDVENKCKQEIERMAKFVIAARHEQAPASRIDDVLNQQEQTTMKKSIVDLSQSLNALANKGHFIGYLRRFHFEYVDVAEYNIDPADTPEAIESHLVTNAECERVLCSNDTLNTNYPDQLHRFQSELAGERRQQPKLHLIYADFTYSTHKLSRMMRLPLRLYRDQDSKTPLVKIQPTHSSSTKTENRFVIGVGDDYSFSPKTEVSTRSPSYVLPSTLKNTHLSISIRDEASSSIPLVKASQTADRIGSSCPTTKKMNTAPATSSKDEVFINILLLGETGVGKSTFVNALANYLTFDTMERAEKNQSVVLIPVSFRITVGDNFDEHIVKFGKDDDENNEDFDHPGQCITQRCRSYVFDMKDGQGTKLRIIDTPGFGDTRGLDRDDYNMAHILAYIKNLSHLNAVCFLLKPNESRLNIFFRSCLTQLFILFDPKHADNILFCFTNCRSTFYTLGNTALLLKKMLTSLPNMNVPFRKDNSFCFNSESFRYLVSLQNKIEFSTQDREDYEMSWTKSATEAQRLIQHICNTLKPFHIPK